PGETPVKRVSHGFHLHVVTEHTLTGIPVVHGRRQEPFKVDAGVESRSPVGADSEMCREDGEETSWWDAVTRIVEDADGSVLGNRHGRNGGVHWPVGDW